MRRIRLGMMFVVALLITFGQSSPATALSAADEAFAKKKIIARWNITGKDQIGAAYARGVDILEDHPNPANGYFTVLVSADELDGLRADGYSLEVIDSDTHKSFAAKMNKTMNGFLTLDEAIEKLDSFYFAFPSLITEKFSIGTSLEGREIWAVKISDNPNIDEDEPEILFNALHHAREPITLEVLIHTMRTLLFNYGTDATITDLVNEREIFFIPVLNPDGYVWNEHLITIGQSPMWRKNRRPNAGGTTGVDLNRNYAFAWGYDNAGSSPTPGSEVYRGTGPFSEPELQRLRDFVISRQFVIAVNYHSYSNLFLWAPGNAIFAAPDETLMEEIGDSVTSFNNYAPWAGWKLYTTNGDADDWLYFDQGVLSFTPEVGSGSDGFWPNPSRIPDLVDENIPGNLFLIDLASSPERLLPPSVATWLSPSLEGGPDFLLEWADAGGINAAVSFQLKELIGRSVTTDFVEDDSAWEMDGFSISSDQAFSGSQSFWGGFSNNRTARMVSRNYYTPVSGDSIRVRVWYNIETSYDYAYVEVSADHGQSWAQLPSSITTNLNPNGKNRGNAINGSSGDQFVYAAFSLAAYVGDPILIRFSYETDGGVLGPGVYFDDIYPVVTYDSEVEIHPALTETEHQVTGKSPGEYFYELTSTDGQGQVNRSTPPHSVTVDIVTCDCSCHGDPLCDGSLDVLDVVATIGVCFRGEPAITDAGCAHGPAGRTDVDCSGANDVLDVVKMVGAAFRGDNPATSFCDPCNP